MEDGVGGRVVGCYIGCSKNCSCGSPPQRRRDTKQGVERHRCTQLRYVHARRVDGKLSHVRRRPSSSTIWSHKRHLWRQSPLPVIGACWVGRACRRNLVCPNGWGSRGRRGDIGRREVGGLLLVVVVVELERRQVRLSTRVLGEAAPSMRTRRTRGVDGEPGAAGDVGRETGGFLSSTAAAGGGEAGRRRRRRACSRGGGGVGVVAR